MRVEQQDDAAEEQGRAYPYDLLAGAERKIEDRGLVKGVRGFVHVDPPEERQGEVEADGDPVDMFNERPVS